MNTANYQSEAGLLATLLTAGTFSIAAVLLALQFLLPANDGIPKAGFYFIAVAAILNLAVGLRLLFCLLMKENRHYYGGKIFLLLCNIPVAALYIKLAF